ncbi:hypothetical protein [Agromyces sp. GXQ0307]|uniref:hypothetical protein n=1 Tax=Agromyces sp. GXQ0307 TaxID=3377835 RepID=UPI00383B2B09
MTRLTHPRSVAPVVAVLLVLGLAACTGGEGARSGTTKPAASTAATADPPSSEPVPEPVPDATTIPATCETVLTPDAYTKLEADGLEPRAATLFDPIPLEVEEAGGLVCSWGKPNTDLVLDVAQIAVGDDEQEWLAQLESSGYTHDDDPVPGGWRGQPDAANGTSPVVVLESGTLTYLSSPVFAEFLLAAS